jgi:hypothetical protein
MKQCIPLGCEHNQPVPVQSYLSLDIAITTAGAFQFHGLWQQPLSVECREHDLWIIGLKREVV